MRELIARIGGGIGSLIVGLVVVALNLGLFSSASGAVREHCLDIDESERAGQVKVDSHWSYVLWPPLPMAGIDPPGRCVRNLPSREALSELGIWSLSSPEEQARRHVLEQLQETASGE